MTKQAERIEPDWYKAWWQEELTRRGSRAVLSGPRFSIVMPCYNTDADILGAAIDSVMQQHYANWELCIADDGSTDPATKQALASCTRADERIRLRRLDSNAGIAKASNAALSLATGDYVLPMDHDDLIPPFALKAVADHLLEYPETRFAYSDSDRLSPKRIRGQPFFKPAWNYDLFLAQNYPNHLTVIDVRLLREVGGWRSGYEGSQDYDLYLRLVEAIHPEAISHIPGVLYHWRETPGAVSQRQLASAVKAARKAIADHLQRSGRPGAVTAPPGAMIYNHVRWELPRRPVRVSLILVGPLSPALELLAREGCEEHPSFAVDIQPRLENDSDLRGLERAFGASTQHDAVVLLSGRAAAWPAETIRELVARCLHEDAGCVAPKCADQQGRLLFEPAPPASPARLHEAHRAEPPPAQETSRGAFSRLLLHQQVEVLNSPALAFRPEHLRTWDLHGSWRTDIHAVMADLSRALSARGYRNVWNGALTLPFEDPGSEVDEGGSHDHDASLTSR